MTAPARRCVVDSPVGRLELVASETHLLRIAWTSAAAAPPPRGSLLARAAEELAAYFAGRRRAFDLPLAPAGSAFQRRVWRAMQDIPYGETLSYGALATKVGSVARAVGGACGANPIPIVVPCHRVVAGHGRLGGFSGGRGAATKRALLALEGALGTGGDLFDDRAAG
jgi:methylated-DNA-[protein]-cysteine S-methyltransferase